MARPNPAVAPDLGRDYTNEDAVNLSEDTMRRVVGATIWQEFTDGWLTSPGVAVKAKKIINAYRARGPRRAAPVAVARRDDASMDTTEDTIQGEGPAPGLAAGAQNARGSKRFFRKWADQGAIPVKALRWAYRHRKKRPVSEEARERMREWGATNGAVMKQAWAIAKSQNRKRINYQDYLNAGGIPSRKRRVQR